MPGPEKIPGYTSRLNSIIRELNQLDAIVLVSRQGIRHCRDFVTASAFLSNAVLKKSDRDGRYEGAERQILYQREHSVGFKAEADELQKTVTENEVF